MKKEARVLIVEEDPFACNWIALLLARDWRTRVVGEAGSLVGMLSFLLNQPDLKTNLVLLDANLLANDPAAIRRLEDLRRLGEPPQVLLLGQWPSNAVTELLPFTGFCGYLLKPEIRYGLAWAAAYTGGQRWVITPGVERLIAQCAPGAALTILDGRKAGFQLTQSEDEFARLAFVFSMERPEVSDEKNVSVGWGYSKISEMYEHLGLGELLSGEVDPAERLGQAFVRQPRF